MRRLPSSLFALLDGVGADIFESRDDPDDRRMGDIILRDDELAAREQPPAVGLLGVPQDIGVRRNHGRAGAAGGPGAVRKALYRLTPFNGAVDLEARLTVADFADLKV